MTADDFLNKHFQEPDDLVNGEFREIFKKRLIEFTTYHVELATKKIKKSIESDNNFWWVETQIDNLNLLENIK